MLEDICKINEFKNALVEVIDSGEDYVITISELKAEIENLKILLNQELQN